MGAAHSRTALLDQPVLLAPGEGIAWGYSWRGRLQRLPPWACDQEVEDLVRDYQRRRGDNRNRGLTRYLFPSPPMTCVAGPAILEGFKGVFYLMTMVALSPVVAYYTSSCDPTGALAEHGAGMTDIVLKICSFVPTFAFLGYMVLKLLFRQTRMMRYTLLPQLMVTGPFELWGLHPPFWLWFFWVSFVAGGNFMNVWMNGEIFGKVLRTMTCEDHIDKIRYHTIAERWDVTFQDYMNRLESLGLQRHWFNFSHVTCALYALLFVQLLPVALHCLPHYERNRERRCCGDCLAPHARVAYKVDFDYEPMQPGDEAARSMQTQLEYPTRWDEQTNHGQVLDVLATLTSSEAVTFQSMAYAVKKLEGYMAHFRENSAVFGNQVGSERELARRKAARLRYYKCLSGMIAAANTRFLTVGLMQQCLQTHLQATIFAINYGMTKKAAWQDPTSLFDSVLMNIIFCLGSDISDMFELFTKFRRHLRADMDEIDDEEVRRQRSTAEHGMCFFILCTVLYLLNAVWVVFILWAATNYCTGTGPNGKPYIGTYNLGLYGVASDGCVELP